MKILEQLGFNHSSPLGVGKLSHVTAPSRLRDNAQTRRYAALQLDVWLTLVKTKLSFLRN